MNINLRGIPSEVLTCFKQVFLIKNCWIFLPGLAAVLLVYVFYHADVCTGLLNKDLLEHLALWLLPAIFLTLMVKSFISRDPLMIYLAVLAFVFLVRELDDTPLTLLGISYTFKSKNLVELLLVIMGLWGLVWHEKLFGSLNRFRKVKISIFGVLWTYFFSQLIAIGSVEYICVPRAGRVWNLRYG